MRKRGFGLIEVLVSAALLLFLIAGTAQLLMLSLAAKSSADFAFAAARRATAMLEHDKTLLFDDPELQPGTTSPAVDDTVFPARLAATRRVEAVNAAMKRITVVVSNKFSPRKKQTYCLTLCRELGF